MSTMTKDALISKIATGANLTKAAATLAFDSMTSAVNEALVQGDDVRLTGIGILKVRTRAASKARNPRTGESIDVAEKRQVKFTQSKELTESLNA